jgi:hypothetical protein
MKKVLFSILVIFFIFQANCQEIFTLNGFHFNYHKNEKNARVRMYNEIIEKVGVTITLEESMIISDTNKNDKYSIISAYNKKIQSDAAYIIKILHKDISTYGDTIKLILDIEVETLQIPNGNKLLLFENCSEDPSNNWDISNTNGDGDISWEEDPIKGKVFKFSRLKSKNDHETFLQKDIGYLVRGKIIRIKSQIKLNNVDSVKYNGQLCVKYSINGKTYYNAVQFLYGTRDWKEWSAQKDNSSSNTINIPINAEDVILYFGIQNASGTIYFKDIKILEVTND